MMWNFLVSGLLTGTTIVLYDGSPGFPDTAAQWRIAERTGATLYGTSAAYVMACRKAGVHPSRDFDLARVRCVATTGSPLPPDGFSWLHDEVRADLWIASVSGGTDVCSCFAGAVPTLPVYIGELQAPGLGTDLQSWDPSGKPLVDEVGELVVTNPMPSMPIRFWNDPDGSRYHGSYFDTYPGVWRHGDWITVTSRGSVVIHGRSDSTLNRQGVRMGSADIYEAVERLPEIKESLVIGVEQPDGGYWMPLFVHLAREPPSTTPSWAASSRPSANSFRPGTSPTRSSRSRPSRTRSPANASRSRSNACSRAPRWRRRSIRAPSTTSTCWASTRTWPASAPDQPP